MKSKRIRTQRDYDLAANASLNKKANQNQLTLKALKITPEIQRLEAILGISPEPPGAPYPLDGVRPRVPRPGSKKGSVAERKRAWADKTRKMMLYDILLLEDLVPKLEERLNKLQEMFSEFGLVGEISDLDKCLMYEELPSVEEVSLDDDLSSFGRLTPDDLNCLYDDDL